MNNHLVYSNGGRIFQLFYHGYVSGLIILIINLISASLHGYRDAYVELEVKGKRVMKLQSRKETYDMNQPRLVIRLVPVPRADWAGKMKIKCPETDLEAELHLVSDSFIERFRGNNNRAVKGKISESSSGSKLYDIFGNWDR